MIHYTSYTIPTFNDIKLKKRFRKPTIKYYNIPIAFDIETTSFYDKDGNKQAYCYIWQMSINKTTIYGRTLEEFKDFISLLTDKLGLNDERRVVIYIHNLEYEFQFIRKYFQWDDVFARQERHPIYAITGGVEFRCSYMLSLLSLKKLAVDNNYPVEKLDDLDYTVPRHYLTMLTPCELQYCENDVLILHHFIVDEMEKNGNDITKIPLTKTGYVRRECRNALKKNKKFWKTYKEKIDNCQPDSELFKYLIRAYQGGYTHANSRYTDITLEKIDSYDLSSSYPTSMIFEKFPWKFNKVKVNSLNAFQKYINNFCCIFEIAFYDLQPKSTHSIISSSKCSHIQGGVIDNGRVLAGDYVRTFLTELDYKNITRFYTFKKITVGGFYISKPEPLPRPLIKVILDKYKDKTSLKGIDSMIREYMIAKGVINGCYGMCVTNPVSDEITYTNEGWKTTTPDIEEKLIKNKESYNTFLLYQWGVWVSAWSRFRLLQTVADIEFYNDDNKSYVLYCDTDSIKFKKSPHVDNIIAKYNKNMIERNKKLEVLFAYEIPKTSKGNKAWLGVFELDGSYDLFKTLGAKRYITYSKKKGLEITVSGLGKEKGGAYISSQPHPFDFFKDGIIVPAEYTGKLTRTYIDEEYRGVLTDYKGVVIDVCSPSAVHLAPQNYEMSLVHNFKMLFQSIQTLDNVGKATECDVHPSLEYTINDVINNLKKECVYNKS